MPKTWVQKVVFGSLMGLIMVYGMEVYNALLRNGGFSGSVFILPVGELALLTVVVILVQEFIGGPLARKMAFSIVSPGQTKPVLVILTVSVTTVCCMCPLMSFVATAMFKGFDGNFGMKWVQTILVNFPMAFFWQLCVAGPLVRYIFNLIFAKQLCDARQ